MSNEQPPPPPPPPTTPYASAVPGPTPAPYPLTAALVADGPVGRVRGTGTCFLLTVVTLGFYTWYWYYATADEMKRHSGRGTDPAVALVLGIFASVVVVFITPNDVGALYERKGQRAPVSATTGHWALLLGWFFLVGLIVWFVKTNEAINAYWRSQGAAG